MKIEQLMIKKCELLNGMQVAKMFGITRSAVYQLASKNKLPALETPLGFLYIRDDIEKIAEKRKNLTDGGSKK